MKAWLLKFFGDLGEFLAVLFNKALNEELKVVLPIAKRLVAQVAADPNLITGSAKREVVIATILAELGAAQMSVGMSVVALAVELAVTKMKQEQLTTEIK
jgi:hypothetical protein